MVKNKYSDIIKLNPLFRSLSSDELTELFNTSNFKAANYKKGSIIHFQNEKPRFLDVILSGTVLAQSIDEEGNVLTVSELTKGELIGLNLLFSQKSHYPLMIIAKTATEVLHLEKTIIPELCMKNKAFLLLILEYLSDRSVFLTDKIKMMSGKSIRQMLLEFLTYEHYSQKSTRIKLPLTKKEMAEKFGVQRTSLSRELQKMRDEGLIEFDRNYIYIKPSLQSRMMD